MQRGHQMMAAMILGALVLLMGTPGMTAHAQDGVFGLVSTEKTADPDKGEKSVSETRNLKGELVGKQIEYLDGKTRNESYNASGQLKIVHETDNAGWNRTVEYKSGKPWREMESDAEKLKTIRFNADEKPILHNVKNRKGEFMEEGFYKDGTLSNVRNWDTKRNLTIVVLAADGETPRLKQLWKHEPKVVGKDGRKTPYVLDSVEVYKDGKLARRLEFAPSDGRTLVKSCTFKNDGSSCVVHLDRKGFVNGTESFGPDGQGSGLTVPSSKTAHKEPNLGELIVDPHFGAHEPGRFLLVP